MLATGRATVSLQHSVIARHAARGIEAQSGASLTLADSRVEQSGNFGIVLFGHSALRMTGGSVSGNRGHGLVVREQATADVSDCRFERNEFSGASAPDAGDGGRLCVRRCTFAKNGMRPIYRGPSYIDPPVPVTARIGGETITVRAAPRCEVDLFGDAVGQAGRYLGTVTAGEDGCFTLSTANIPPGESITASVTTLDGQTGEFNVVAARLDRAILAALLARTGPLADGASARVDEDALVHRWRSGAQLVFRFEDAPPANVQRYSAWFAKCLDDWIGGAIRVRIQTDAAAAVPDDAVLVPIRFAESSDENLGGAGGTTWTRWDAQGFFTGPIRIFLSRPERGATPVRASQRTRCAMRWGCITRASGCCRGCRAFPRRGLATAMIFRRR